MSSFDYLAVLLLFSYASSQTEDGFLANLFEVPKDLVLSVAENFIFQPVPDDQVTFVYFPSSGNQPTPITSENFATYLNENYTTKMLIHGWHQNTSMEYIQTTASLYNTKGDYNVIAVDWSVPASKNYTQAAATVQYVGYLTADFIIAVTEKFSNFPSKLHIVGHSLGAHIGGFAGKKVKEQTGKIIDRITGNDVAGPLFEFPLPRPCELRLCQTDASFVDLIHTNVGCYGIKLAIGTADFFVNGGGPIQPECKDEIALDMRKACYCSHETSNVFFYETIPEPEKYEAQSCTNYLSYQTGLCQGTTAYMGDGVSRDAKGKYYVDIE